MSDAITEGLKSERDLMARNGRREKVGKVVYTIGYGNRKPDDFVKLLKDAGITVVLDVRRKGSKSWCGAYRWGNGMASLLWGDLEKELPDITYLTVPELANHATHINNLADYKWSVDNGAGRVFIKALRDEILPYADTFVYCVVCAELKAFNKLASANCHRVPLADALVKELGEGWRCVHL